MRLHRGPGVLAGRAPQGTAPGRREEAPSLPPHVPDAQAGGRAHRRRLALLGDQGPRAGAPAAAGYRRRHQGRWHAVLPADPQERAGAGAADAATRVPGLALSGPCRGAAGSRAQRGRKHRRHAAEAQEAAGGAGTAPDSGGRHQRWARRHEIISALQSRVLATRNPTVLLR